MKEWTLEAGTRVLERYVVEELIGKGGMAEVHRALDEATGRTVALKVMATVSAEPPKREHVELFEREFHTLVHLAHPRVVAAYDYGVDRERPFYAMEHLDGGDLQALSPLPWSEACVVAYEICSALALIHSRSLVHRDVTPRNIRRTADGKAKLIDFGLLSPMGPTSLLAGTPPFVAPELVATQSLDGRSDLFSLGATLYFALTGRPPYPARSFETLRDAWRSSPSVPSSVVSGIPAAVDDLVLSMLRIDSGSRPKSAAEVMDRLRPLLPASPAHDLRVDRAYVTTPRLVGRDEVVNRFRKLMVQAVRRHGGGIAIVGDEGTGRSRMLDAFVLEAKLVGATTARVGAADGTGPFGAAAALARQLQVSSPAVSAAAAASDARCSVLFQASAGELADVAALPRAAAQAALRTWLLAYAERRPLAIAVDDFEHIDEPSAVLLASLTWGAKPRRLAYAVTLERSATDHPSPAVAVVRRQASELSLVPLHAAETRALLASLFGDVPHLTLLADRLHALCDGRPRDCMALAQFLIDRGAITHANGAWVLPAELPEGLLPASIEGAFSERIALLEPLSRRLAALLSLSLLGRLSRAELSRMNRGADALDASISELVRLRLITGDTSGYAPRHGSLARLLTASLERKETEALHDDLAYLYASAESHPFVTAYHELQGRTPDAGLDRILERSADSEARTLLINMATNQLGTALTMRALELALERAEKTGRRQHDLQILWVMLVGTSAIGDDASFYYRVRDCWLEQLKHDSGWHTWHALEASLDPSARAMMAVGATIQRYGETPEADRVLAPPDAIKQLVAYVVFSIAIAVRTFDVETMVQVSELLAPFAPLNPMVAAMLDNARATRLNGEGKREQARAKFVEVLDRLADMTGADLAFVEKVRTSIALTLGKIDVSLGVRSAWVEKLSEAHQDANQLVGAAYLLKVEALQRGDWKTAEAFRQKAELLALQANATSMFSTLAEELEAHAMARELTGLKQVRAAIHGMAAAHPGWVPVRHLANAHYLRLCNDLEGALVATEAAIVAGGGAQHSAWTSEARTLAAEILAEQGRPDEGLARALPELEWCELAGMPYLGRGLALAAAQCEARLGRHEAAMARIERVIAEQVALGVAGVQLGRSYELGARTAIAMGDRAAFARLAGLSREQYRSTDGSVLGGLYERLLEDARTAGLGDSAEAPLESGLHLTVTSRDRVTADMAGCSGARERAERALALLCDGDPPVRGHLFLITEAGLTCVASNAECGSPAGLTAFAQGALDSDAESDDSHTGAFELDTVEHGGTYQDGQGTRYGALLLGTMIDGEYVIGGIAVLAGSSGRLASVAGLAESLARTLIDAGDTQAFRARSSSSDTSTGSASMNGA